jgi:hypothetical protein
MSANRKTLPLKVRAFILERDAATCQRCFQQASPGNAIEVDHILPLAEGGSDDPKNLQCLCFKCNSGKGSLTKEARAQAAQQEARMARTALYVIQIPPTEPEPEGAYKATTKQKAFRETVSVALSEGVYTLPGWCNLHRDRQREDVTAREFQRWEGIDGFLEWFNEVLPPSMSEFERTLADRLVERNIADRAVSDDPRTAASAAGQWRAMRGSKADKEEKPSASKAAVLAAMKARKA